MEIIDKSGDGVSLTDIEDGIDAITKALVNPKTLVALPSELAVNLPNVRRCLIELLALRQNDAHRRH